MRKTASAGKKVTIPLSYLMWSVGPQRKKHRQSKHALHQLHLFQCLCTKNYAFVLLFLMPHQGTWWLQRTVEQRLSNFVGIWSDLYMRPSSPTF